MLRLSPGRELFPAAEDRGVGLVVRDPHAGGTLDAFSPQPFDSHEAADPRARPGPPSLAQRLHDLQFLAEHHPDAGLYELALAYCLAQPAVASALPDLRDLEGVQRVVAAAAAEAPSRDCQEQIAAVYDAECEYEDA